MTHSITRKDFLKLAGLTAISFALPSCENNSEIDPIPDEVRANRPIDWKAMTVEHPVDGLEVVRFNINDYCTVTYILTEHEPEDVNNDTKMTAVKGRMTPGGILISEYHPGMISQTIQNNKLADLHTNADVHILPFFNRIIQYALDQGMGWIVTDPANWESFLDINVNFYGISAPDDFDSERDPNQPYWREKQSYYRNTINAAFLLSIANKLEADQAKTELVIVTAPAHGRQQLEILQANPNTSVSLLFPKKFAPIEPLNKNYTRQVRQDQFTARFYKWDNSNGTPTYAEMGTMLLH